MHFAQLSESESALKALESELSGLKIRNENAATNLVEAKRLERCIVSWGLAELEKLKRYVEKEMRNETGMEDGFDRDQLEKELDDLEAKISGKRKQIQHLREIIDQRKGISERLLAEFFRLVELFMKEIDVIGMSC